MSDEAIQSGADVSESIVSTPDTGAESQAQAAPIESSASAGASASGERPQPTGDAHSPEQAAQPQVDPAAAEALRNYGYDPTHLKPGVTAAQVHEAMRVEHQRLRQRAEYADQLERQRQYEIRQRQAAAQDASRAQGGAHAASQPKPEPVDLDTLLSQAMQGPKPPAYAEALLRDKHIFVKPNGKFGVSPGSAHIVDPADLEEINQYVADAQAHQASSAKALKEALVATARQEYAREREREANESHIREFDRKNGAYLRDAHGNPTPLGQAFYRELKALQGVNLPPRQRFDMAWKATIGDAAPALFAQMQQRAQQPQQPPQPQPQATAQAPAPVAEKPQPKPNFLETAAYSPAGTGSAGGNGKAPRHQVDLWNDTFGKAASALAGR